MRLRDRRGYALAWRFGDVLPPSLAPVDSPRLVGVPDQIFLALTDGDSPALGNIWRLTSKKTDFYLDPLGEAGALHLSAHGPNEKFDGHRFHIRIDREMVEQSVSRGDYFVQHGIPRKGVAVGGKKVAPGAFHVARLRWTWHLQRQRFRHVAQSMSAPEIQDHQAGGRLGAPLNPNSAWDIDLVVSYGEPYWPNASATLRDNARLGPLRNGSGMWLTATSYHRSQMTDPAPAGLTPPLPRDREDAMRILCGGRGEREYSEVYWFVETVTSRQLLGASPADG